MFSFALSQREYPKGIGIEDSIDIKNNVLIRYDLVGKSVVDIPLKVLEEVLYDIGIQYLKIKKRRSKWHG